MRIFIIIVMFCLASGLCWAGDTAVMNIKDEVIGYKTTVETEEFFTLKTLSMKRESVLKNIADTSKHMKELQEQLNDIESKIKKAKELGAK